MKNKSIAFILGFIFFIAITAATFYPEPWGNDVDAGNNNLNNVNNITANNFIGNVTGEHLGEMDWANLKNYPTFCPGNSAITGLNDSSLCEDLWLDSTGGVVSGDVNISKDLLIFDSSDLGSEIHTQANAASDPNGNEADALTGWNIVSGALASVSTDPFVGTYNLRGDSNDDTDYMEYSFTSVVGKTYKITFAAKRGAGTTQEVSNWTGFTTSPNFPIPSTSWATYEVIVMANDTTGLIKIWPAVGGIADDKVHVDNFSIKEVQGGDINLYGLITGGGINGIKVLGNGNVGIGTTNPSESLDVNGSVNIGGNLIVSGNISSDFYFLGNGAYIGYNSTCAFIFYNESGSEISNMGC